MSQKEGIPMEMDQALEEVVETEQEELHTQV
jgi:hypothetical protein